MSRTTLASLERGGGSVAKLMQGVGSFEQLQDYATKIAPMGQMGLKLFQQFLESSTGMAGGGKK